MHAYDDVTESIPCYILGSFKWCYVMKIYILINISNLLMIAFQRRVPLKWQKLLELLPFDEHENEVTLL